MAVEGTIDQGAVIPSVQVETLLAQHTRILQLVRDALAKLLEADRLAESSHFGSQWAQLAEAIERSRYRRFREAVDVDPTPEIMKAFAGSLDNAGWEYLMNASGMRSFMDAEAREDWANCLAKGQAPSFTLANIAATFENLHASRGDMVERGIIKTFQRLSWNYKSNLPHRLGRKLIVSYVRSYYNSGADGIDDLMRALCVFDGKPEPDHRHSAAALVRGATNSRTTVETPYFELRVFKNGNGHVIFKAEAMHLVDKLNAVIARHYPGALPAAHA